MMKQHVKRGKKGKKIMSKSGYLVLGKEYSPINSSLHNIKSSATTRERILHEQNIWCMVSTHYWLGTLTNELECDEHC